MRRIKTLIKELYKIECEIDNYEPKTIVKAINELEARGEIKASTLIDVVFTGNADLMSEEEYQNAISTK